MMPVATVQSLARAGCLVLRKGLAARSELFHAREDGRFSAICGYAPSTAWSEDYPRDGGGVCQHCRKQLRRAGFYVSMMGVIAEDRQRV